MTQRRIMNETEISHIPKLSPMNSFITLIKGFIGSGILYLPNSFLVGGYGFSVIALLASCFLSMYCVTLLLAAKKKLNVNSYKDIGVKTLGEPGKHTVNVLIILSQFGFCCGYLYFIIQNLYNIIGHMRYKEDPIALGLWKADTSNNSTRIGLGIGCLVVFSLLAYVRKV
jgi:amino acid permease